MKFTQIILLIALTGLLLLTACGVGASPEPAPAPVVEQPPAIEPAAPAPAEPVAPEPTQPQFAPTCQTAATGCEAPNVEMLDNKFCVDKWPYAIMSVPAGSTYEPLDDRLKCQDQMHADGNLRITCNDVEGRQLYSYDLKVCSGACTAPALEMGSSQCPDGYGYDAANTCCAQPPATDDEGCTIFSVDLGACPGG